MILDTLSKYCGIIRVLEVITMLFPIPNKSPIKRQNHVVFVANVLPSRPMACMPPPTNSTVLLPKQLIKTLVAIPNPNDEHRINEKATLMAE